MAELTLLYVHGTQIGYARMGSCIADELTSRGYTIYDMDGRPPEFIREGTVQRLTDGSIPPPSPTNVISWMSVPTHRDGAYDGQYNSILTMWETRFLPEGFRDTLHEYDLVMVPSPQNVELFGKYHDNVQLVTLGIDPTIWHPVPTPPVGQFFDFLIAGRGNRKGTDLAYRAFRTVFKDFHGSPTPRLIMKSLQGHGQFFAENVIQRPGLLSDVDERDLYARAHAYIQPSRGEGFGLQPLQAMALGRPTILTDAHGHGSFAHLGIPIPTASSKADYFIYGDAGEWWEPDFDSICEAMWDVYNDYATHAERAQRNALTVADFFSWRHTVDQFVAAHDGQLDQPFTGTTTWTRSVRRLYEIITTRDYTSDICGVMYQFKAGKSYHVFADVKRILFAIGILDPSCCGDGDQGLAPSQVDQLGKYRADHEWCPSCGQRMNSGIKRSDYIFDELNRDAEERERELA